MDNYVVYLIEANVLMLIMTLVYFLVRNQLSFSQRRWTLLMIPVLTLLVFAAKFSGVSQSHPVYHLPVYEINALKQSTEDLANSQPVHFSYTSIYWFGATVFASILFLRFILIFSKLASSKKENRNGLKVVYHENEPCYSFLNYVQLNPNLSATDREVIFQHEQIHISKKHSYDKLYIEFMHAVNWFNPIMIALKRELINVHEFEVDQVMYARHKTSYMEFLVSYSLGINSTPFLLTNQFFTKKILIKRLNSMKNKTKNHWAFALTLPVIAGAFSLVSLTYADQHKPTPSNSMIHEKIVEELDKMPEFIGGQTALVTYLSNAITYPESAKNSKIEGTVYVSFMVEKTGKVLNSKIKKSVHADLDAEALRVVTSMPDWNPGEKNGKTVNCEMVLPINFKL